MARTNCTALGIVQTPSRLAVIAAAVLGVSFDRDAQAQTWPSVPSVQMGQVTYGAWKRFCLKDPKGDFCYTSQDGLIGETNIAAVVVEPPSSQKKILRFTLPLGMILAHGTRSAVDNGPPQQQPFVICFPIGCLADYELTPQLLADMKKGGKLVIQAINAASQQWTVSFPLAGFTKAYEGPPTDPKKLDEMNQAITEELKKRAPSNAGTK